MSKLTPDEWKTLYLETPRPLTWWEQVLSSSRYTSFDGRLGPPRYTCYLFCDEKYQAEAWVWENTHDHNRISNDAFLAYPMDENEIAPEPMLYIIKRIDQNIRGDRDFFWFEYVGYNSSKNCVIEQLYLAFMITSRLNDYQPPLHDRAADAACWYSNMREYMGRRQARTSRTLMY